MNYYTSQLCVGVIIHSCHKFIVSSSHQLMKIYVSTTIVAHKVYNDIHAPEGLIASIYHMHCKVPPRSNYLSFSRWIIIMVWQPRSTAGVCQSHWRVVSHKSNPQTLDNLQFFFIPKSSQQTAILHKIPQNTTSPIWHVSCDSKTWWNCFRLHSPRFLLYGVILDLEISENYTWIQKS